MGFSRILAEFAEKMWLAENLPEKNTASRKSAEKVGQPAEYNKKIRLVGLSKSEDSRPIISRCRFIASLTSESLSNSTTASPDARPPLVNSMSMCSGSIGEKNYTHKQPISCNF